MDIIKINIKATKGNKTAYQCATCGSFLSVTTNDESENDDEVELICTECTKKVKEYNNG